MTIKKAIENARRVQGKLSVHNKNKEAADTIEALIRIIYWYDDNQRRLIKGIVNRNREKRELISLIVGDADDAT